ncbi:BnaCnng77550D [Brassica napus]|uniref:BnaCnng77550D protein n=1 Tax=Brassica napus TaxID=3708 RepID=A0A078K3T7_BRANA|nr:BnaCnng77550D [Brassica napus]
MRNEETNEDMLYEDTNGGEMSDDQDPETQHNEEIYCLCDGGSHSNSWFKSPTKR